jgi:hypothetical protein
VTFIAGSAFLRLEDLLISIETGNPLFSVEDSCIFHDVQTTFIRYFGSVSSLVIPQDVEIIGPGCFSSCELLSSISFESNSQLKRIESQAFAGTRIGMVLLPAEVAFIAGDAFPADCAVSLADDSCPEFREWISLRGTGSNPDFERKQRTTAAECIVDLSPFELVKALGIAVHHLAHREARCGIAVTSFPLLSAADEDLFRPVIEALIKLDDRCIVPFFGFVPQAPPDGPQVATRFMPGCSLRDVLASSPPPAWWTGSAMAIVVAGIVSGMTRMHEASIAHRRLRPDKVLLDKKHRPRICDIASGYWALLAHVGTARRYAAPELYNTKADVYSFALILYEIVVGRPAFPHELAQDDLCRRAIAGERAEIPAAVDPFVANLIRRGWAANPAERPSFREIFNKLRSREFCVVRNGFNRHDVARYFRWIGLM